MDYAFDIAIKNRKLLSAFIENHTLKELNKVPDGFNNSIIWNIAHTIVTQQILVYRLSELPMSLSNEMVTAFKKGTKTEKDLSQAEVDIIKSLLFSTIEKTKEDYNNDIFKTFTEYTVSTKSILSNVEEAIAFNNFHEGIHFGYILALRKSL
ncbi:hypothetical protein FBALC1_00902 [Flavobacteriales bacterium ALC-1]|nr:hypothetical protein FBALC1_00902 [Flavobacteriales bacterium ALC-1]